MVGYFSSMSSTDKWFSYIMVRTHRPLTCSTTEVKTRKEVQGLLEVLEMALELVSRSCNLHIPGGSDCIWWTLVDEVWDITLSLNQWLIIFRIRPRNFGLNNYSFLCYIFLLLPLSCGNSSPFLFGGFDPASLIWMSCAAFFGDLTFKLVHTISTKVCD